jgi:hypothetical protein
MISEDIQKRIDSARKFGEELELIVVNKKELPASDRNILLIAYWALLFDYDKGILSLLQAEFFGSAFALCRPVAEAVVRAHLAICGSDEELKALQNDDYRVNFKDIGPRLDAAFGLEGLMQNFLSEKTRSALHSYTHSGVHQLGRRFDGNDLKQSYKDEEIIEVINVTSSAIFMISNLVTKHFGFEDEWKKVGPLYGEWGKH